MGYAVMMSWTVVAVTLPSIVAGQELVHPREMNLQRPAFQLPDTAQFMFNLQNGLRGFVVGDRRTELITLTAFVRAGTADDRVQGAAEALAYLLGTRGPCWMAPGRFAAAIDEMAARYEVRISEEFTEISLNVPTEDAGRALEIFSGMVREPCIYEEGVEEFRRETARRAAPLHRVPRVAEGTVADASFDIAMALFEEHLYGDHPYNAAVTLEDAARLTVEDVERFHEDYFVPANAVVAVAGAVEPREIVREVDQRFGDWEVRRPPRPQAAPDVRTTAPRQEYRYAVDKLQTWVVLGHELPPVDPRDWPALEVMNYILGGGHFDTRLFKEARDKRGLTNDASGFPEPNVRGPGTYTFRTSGRPEVAQQLVDIILREIERIREEPVSDEELAVAKGALADGDLAMKFANGHTAARFMAEEYAKYGTLVHLVRYPDRIRDVSVGDLRDAARRYLHPDRMLIVTVGPSEVEARE